MPRENDYVCFKKLCKAAGVAPTYIIAAPHCPAPTPPISGFHPTHSPLLPTANYAHSQPSPQPAPHLGEGDRGTCTRLSQQCLQLGRVDGIHNVGVPAQWDGGIGVVERGTVLLQDEGVC